MALTLRLPEPGALAEIIEALHTSADVCEERAPELAVARRELADLLGDALERLPKPSDI